MTNTAPTRKRSPSPAATRRGRAWPTTEADATRDPRRLTQHPQAGLVPEMRPADYHSFLADVAQRGVQTPIDITRRGVVLDGRHRLRAALDAGLGRVPVRVVAPADEVDYLVRAAIQRRHLTQSQVAAVVVQLADYHATRTHSKHRQRANLTRRGAAEVETLPTPTHPTLTSLATAYNISPRLLQDAHTIHTLAPDQLAAVAHGQIPAHTLANRLRRHHRDSRLTTPPLPAGRFQVILADPPWQLGNPDSAFAPEQHYPTQPTTDICALAVPATKNAILFLWAVSGLLPDALRVIDAWGFIYKTNLAWVKQGIGPGVWLRNRHELLLIAIKGAWTPPPPEARVDSVITANRRRHSQKPDRAYQLIETMYPTARRLELYARAPRIGWTGWGNQLDTQEPAA